MLFMGSYSPERKAAVIARMLPPNSQWVYRLSRQENIPVNTLYGWWSQAVICAQSVNSDDSWHRPLAHVMMRHAVGCCACFLRCRQALSPVITGKLYQRGAERDVSDREDIPPAPRA